MRISEQRKNEIIQAFQASFKRDNAGDIGAIPLAELREADEMLGNRDVNAGFRLAMQNKIQELESIESRAEQRSYESKIRAWNIVFGIIVGLVIAGLANLLFGSGN